MVKPLSADQIKGKFGRGGRDLTLQMYGAPYNTPKYPL